MKLNSSFSVRILNTEFGQEDWQKGTTWYQIILKDTDDDVITSRSRDFE